eukprot:Platyproteum_vivax@DN5680_c0_g1_i1.p1
MNLLKRLVESVLGLGTCLIFPPKGLGCLPDEPLLRGKIHLLLIYFSPAWIPPLFKHCQSVESMIAAGIAVVSMTYNFLASAILHNSPWKTHQQRMLANKFDHAGIFIMIAGCCAPVPILLFQSWLRWLCLAVQWGFALFGICMSAYGDFSTEIGQVSTNSYRAAIYVTMGLLYSLFAVEMIRVLTPFEIVCMFSLAGFYIVGALFYARRKPNPIPRYVGYHELFHICCLVAAVFTFMLDLSVLQRVSDLVQ